MKKKWNNHLITDLVETFEDFLDEKGIVIPNEDKEQSEGASNIYGMDFACLMGELRETLAIYGINCEDTWS